MTRRLPWLALPFIALLTPLAVSAAVGTKASEFTLPAAPGGPTKGRFKLAQHLGQRPVAILFWATWCGPCLAEMSVYQELFQKGDGKLMVVGVSMDGPDTVAQVGSAARNLGLSFPIVTDLDSQVTAMYNPRRAAPFSVWIDREGKIVREHEGFALSERPAIEKGVEELLRGPGTAPVPPDKVAPPKGKQGQ